MGGQTGIPHPLILRCCLFLLFRTLFSFAFEFLMLLLSVFLFKMNIHTYIHTYKQQTIYVLYSTLYYGYIFKKMTEGQPN